MRTYHYYAYDGRKNLAGEGFGWVVETTTRIHQLAIELFREQFNRDPREHYGMNGFMAEAWDNYVGGPKVELTQINFINPFAPRGCPVCMQPLRLRFTYWASGARKRPYFLCRNFCYGCDSTRDRDGYILPAFNRPPHPRRLLPAPKPMVKAGVRVEAPVQQQPRVA